MFYIRFALTALILNFAISTPATAGFVITPTITPIHDVQGSGSTVTGSGTEVTVEGVVIGDYQSADELKGFFLQEEDTEVDGDPNTSEGLFVYCDTCTVDVVEGQIVLVTGVQEDYFGMSQLSVPVAAPGSVSIIDAGDNSWRVTPTSVDLPAPAGTDQEATFEAIEGMLVRFVDTLTVTEYFQLGRFGQVVLSEGGRQRIFTEGNPPDQQGYSDHLVDREKRRIILDDPNDTQNSTDPVFHPQPNGFSTTHYFRGGDTVSNLTGVLHWSWAGSGGTNHWRIRPQISNPISFTSVNSRPTTPDEVGGDIVVASVNVLNFFSTVDIPGNSGCGPSAILRCRGADSAAELVRQTDKLVAALVGMDADIVGLMEIENNAAASLQTLIDALNAQLGAGSYGFINTGVIGNDAIKNGVIYKTAVVAPMGTHAVLDSPAFVDPKPTGSDKNRPALAQTFEVIESANPSYGEELTTTVLHLKSKGSGCGVGDDDTTTGQGNCNLTRSLATKALMDWLAQDPTGSGDADVLILGDLNAYAMEDPVTTLKLGADDVAASADDFVDLLDGLDNGYSYVFNGEIGSLQRFFANTELASRVSGVTAWHVNADEVNLLDYNDTIVDSGEASFEAKPSANTLYNADAYRFSDHDPLLVGLNLTPQPFCFPVPAVNGKIAVICL